MSNHPGVEKTLELLDSLKTTVREFAASEEKLNQELKLKLAREVQHRDETAAEQLARFTAESAALEDSFQSSNTTAEARYQKRKAWISEARKSSKEQSLERIESRTGHRKYELQKKLIQAERTRDASLVDAATACQDFKTNLAQEQETLAALEAKTRASFSGYRKFVRLLSAAPALSESDLAPDEQQLLKQLGALLVKTRGELDRFRKSPLPVLFKYLPVWLLVVLCPVALVLQHFQFAPISQPVAISVTGALLALIVLRYIGRQQAGPSAAGIARALVKARGLHDAGFEKCETRYHQDVERARNEFQSTTQTIDQQLKLALKENVGMKGDFRERVDEKTVRIAAKNETIHRAKMEQLQRDHTAAVEVMKLGAEARERELTGRFAEREAGFEADHQARWSALETDWKSKIQPIYAAIQAANASAEKLFPAWESESWKHWTPPSTFESAAKFARLEVDLKELCEITPKDKRLALPGASRFSLPLLLNYPEQGSILLETANSRREETIGVLNNLVLRLLSVAPPGRLNFTIIDPVGLGQNFAGVMHLADYEERLINSRIWTQAGQIEQKLADLNEHMEKVIQMYLRNEYQTIAEYNEQAGNIAEKYHFLVVADFPANFTDTAVKRLLSIAASGARCGVYTLIHWDHRQPVPQDFLAEQFRKAGVSISGRGSEFILTGHSILGANLVLDPPPTPEVATEFIHTVGRASKDSSRVEVPFSHVTPPDTDIWTLETTNELRIPIGRTGATKLQYLAIGKGTRQHALIAGKTGSGKSTLFHVIITNLSLWCSPEQVEFYLIDFKKGVEFKCYATRHLPHARVVAIESDREFGLSVLQRVDDELRRRGDLFRALGAQDIAGYKRAGGTEPIPRSLLMIDEFQEFFVEDDKVSQTASVLLDRIVRQGRAFGIHVLLGSQTLGGAYTLARTTLGQMVIRIALQCNEADAYLIMDENNPAPRLLSRPGEGIYNDAAGSVEGNSPFQAVWLPDEVRDASLDKVIARAARGSTAYPGPVVFEGNAPSDVRDNPALRELIEAPSTTPPVAPRIWLGAPNSIKGPTEAVFHRQSGNNLLIVGQREEAALAILSVALISLAAQYPSGAARFFLFDGNAPGSPQRELLEQIIAAIPHKITVARNNELADVMNGLATDLKSRQGDQSAAEAPPTFLLFHGIQKFNKLRHEEDFSFSTDDAATPNPGAQLNNILTEGTNLGFHVIATCDSYNNVNRFFSRKAFGEFELRVLFQMGANDSASLIDSPKASTLGLHRAIFYNEQEGYLEVFRPYALPTREWIETTARNLSRLAAGS
ncbi:MAG: segregation ATPase, FtsK/SpoIIIE family [Pedosphaera sp.]|nr:segregation ATPase, FtsK/SpoIIIE family [Pedosphaera sp.]